MWIYVVRRAALLFPVLIGVMTITFACVSALPVYDRLVSAYGYPPPRYPPGYDPTYDCSYWNANATGTCPNPLYVTHLHALGLDKPIYIQWATYMYNTFSFNWGQTDSHSYVVYDQFTFLRGQSVVQAVGDFLPYTLELAALSLLIIMAIAIPLGNLSAANRNRPIDQASRVLSFSGYALPGFLLGGLAVTGVTMLFIAHFGRSIVTPWCPGGEPPGLEFINSWPSARTCYSGALSIVGYPLWMANGVSTTPTGFPTVDAIIHHQYWLALDTLIRMIIPALVIAFGSVAGLLRFVRNSMLEVMSLDFVRTARAKGVPEKVVVNRHAGRNSLNVTITVLGLTFAGFIGGFAVIESVFNLWGVGRLLAYSIINPLDFGLIFGSTVLFTWIIVFANVAVDILYAYLDPRVRLG